jgi:DNA-binding XRE family transcriptional regulator
MDIVNRLPEIIAASGYRKGFVAKEAQISNATLTNLLNGSIPTLKVGYAIAHVLNKRIDEIWIPKTQDTEFYSQ